MPKANRKSTARSTEPQRPAVDEFRRRHLALAQRRLALEDGCIDVTVDEAESPLGWLARRRGRDGQPLIAPHQLLAGEKLRADFTRAQLTPRTTSNWDNPISSGRGSAAAAGTLTDAVVAARQRVNLALEAVGPEFSGLLLDICCFLKGLEDIERARAWPTRSAKIVLQLALDRLARHYGYAAKTSGLNRTFVRTWLAEGAEFKIDSV